MLLLLVDGGLVDEHVVVVLAEDHEVVTDWQEVVADRQESSRKSVEDCFSFRYGKTCVFTGLGWCRRELALLTAPHPSLQTCSKCAKSQSVLTKNLKFVTRLS